MKLLALLTIAALIFSILAGVIEEMGARRARRRLKGKALPVLHPFPQAAVIRRVRQPLYWRAFHHVGLFFGFLAVTYLGLLALRLAHGILVRWF
jgi:hypothetical protein